MALIAVDSNMPQVIRPSTITIQNGENGVGKLIITLELNINLNANGVQAVVPGQVEAQAVVPSKPKYTPDDDHVDFVIPDFGSSESINFGKKVKD